MDAVSINKNNFCEEKEHYLIYAQFFIVRLVEYWYCSEL